MVPINLDNGRPIQVAIFVRHILNSLVLGKILPLRRLARSILYPTIKQWEELHKREELTGMYCSGKLATSGENGEVHRMSD